MRRALQRFLPLLLAILVVALVYASLHLALGTAPFSHSTYDSYTLQALSWREGRLSLGQDYPWLELAVYEGDWYVSFPPVPSIPMWLLTFLFGRDTPDGLMVKLYAVGAMGILYFCFLDRFHWKPWRSALSAALFAFAGPLFTITLNGAVWFQAQALNFLMLVAAFSAMVYERPTLSCVFYALAVGCRPFSVFFGPALLVLYLRIPPQRRLRASPGNDENKRRGIFVCRKEPERRRKREAERPTSPSDCVQSPGVAATRRKPWGGRNRATSSGERHSGKGIDKPRILTNSWGCSKLFPGILAGLAIAAGYAWYNFARFQNPLEFGHNYLPEFTRAEAGQFSLSYLAKNLRQFLLGLPVKDGQWQLFGFSMLLSNLPLTLLLLLFFRDLVLGRLDRGKVAILCLTVAHLFCLLLHKSFGGLQFGARYTLELAPFLLVWLRLEKGRAPALWEDALLGAGAIFNAWGAYLLNSNL